MSYDSVRGLRGQITFAKATACGMALRTWMMAVWRQ